MPTLNLTTLVSAVLSNEGAVRRAVVALALSSHMLSNSDSNEAKRIALWIVGANNATFRDKGEDFMSSPLNTGRALSVTGGGRSRFPRRDNPMIARDLVMRNVQTLHHILVMRQAEKLAASVRLLDFDEMPATKRYGT